MNLLVKTTIGLSLIVILNTPAVGQLSRTEGMMDISNDMSHTLVQQIPFSPITTEGSYYYLDEWKEGQIELKNEIAIKGFTFKYDIENNLLVLNVRDQLKVLEGSRVSKFVILDNINSTINFVSAENFELESLPQVGFFEVLVDGKVKLYSKTSMSLKAATYNAAIDMGTEENKIIREEVFFLEKEGDLIKLSKKKKKLLASFGEHQSTLDQYLKETKLGIKKRNDLQKIVKYVNTL